MLEAAELVRAWREDRYKLHSIDPGPLEQIAERWLEPRKDGR